MASSCYTTVYLYVLSRSLKSFRIFGIDVHYYYSRKHGKENIFHCRN
jgi:hypothetical protein